MIGERSTDLLAIQNCSEVILYDVQNGNYVGGWRRKWTNWYGIVWENGL
jgi:hypothetical protein